MQPALDETSMGLSSRFSLSHLDAVGMIISENIPGQKWVKEEGKDLPVPGKAVVAVVAKHRLAVLDRVGSCPRNSQLKFGDKNCPRDCR